MSFTTPLPCARTVATLAIIVMALLLAPPLRAQDQPVPVTSLVADVVRVDGQDRLTASGNVEVFAAGRRLSASRLIYDRAEDRLTLEGPIVLQDGDDLLVLADNGALDADLRDGLLKGVRLILRQQLQIAGAELSRSEGRFNDLREVVASSCEVCLPGEPPLWEIRARRVIHDQEAARIYFYDARFRIAGTPVFYVPVLRLPDGTQTRATGFLTPAFRTTTQLGPGLKLPYFITLGRSADLTLTPYVATRYTRTLEARYRRLFTNGEIEFSGALSRDSILPGQLRGYLFGEGVFDIPRGYELTFDIQTASDDPYLSDYDFSDLDRLASGIGILRTRDGERVQAEALYYQSLRADEDNDLVPTLVGDVRWDRRYAPGAAGGWLDLSLLGHGHMRPSTDDIDGRDSAQFRGSAAWNRIWTLAGGLRFTSSLLANTDVKYIAQDSRYPEWQAAVTPTGLAELSWPLAARDTSGARYLLEPVAQLAYTPNDNIDSPNDDSTLIAFDSGNLLTANRFPGLDRTEEGLRTNLALRWTRIDPDKWSLGVTLGKVYRQTDLGQFPAGSGLAENSSDWLTQVDLDIADRLQLRSLLLLDTGFEATLNDTRLSIQSDNLQLAANYVWQRSDRSFDLDTDLSELAVDAAYDITRSLSARLDLRRDLVASRTNRAEFGVSWRNECVRVDLSAIRRFRATQDVEPTTSYGLSVTLAGFGVDDSSYARRQRCAPRG